MKLKHVILIAVVSSIMDYLNDQPETDREQQLKQAALRNNIRQLVKDKLESFNFEQAIDLSDQKQLTNCEEAVGNLTDSLLNELNAIIAAYEKGKKQESTPVQAKKSPYSDLLAELETLVTKTEEKKHEDLLVNERKNIVANIEDFFKKTSAAPSDNDNLAAIQKTIDNLLSLSATQDSKKEAVGSDIDKIFAEIINQEKSSDETLKAIDELLKESISFEAEKPEVKAEEKVEVKEEKIPVKAEVKKAVTELDDDLKDYINELNEALAEKEKKSFKEVNIPRNDIYEQINQLYPNLTRDFVHAVYDLKETIAQDYPLNRPIILLQRLLFDDINYLNQFVEIVMDHSYQVNVDEKQMIVDILKKFTNTDGKILANIFAIADQAGSMGGEYEGYRVEVCDWASKQAINSGTVKDDRPFSLA